MSRYSGNGDKCKHCGVTYGETRTGMTYREVWLMMWHKTEFKYKRRGTVLGLWHSIKKSLWERHLEAYEAEHDPKNRARDRGDPQELRRGRTAVLAR